MLQLKTSENTELKLECLKLAFQAAIQYGAFKPENLSVHDNDSRGRPNHNWGTHFKAILALADGLYLHLTPPLNGSVSIEDATQSWKNI